MAKERRMNRAQFDKIIKEKTGYAEGISALQRQKQDVMDEFERERKRYRKGEISRAELRSAIPRVRKEMTRLDREIKRNIAGVEAVSRRSVDFARRQVPTSFVLNEQGIKRSGVRRATKRKAATRSTRKTTRKTRRR